MQINNEIIVLGRFTNVISDIKAMRSKRSLLKLAIGGNCLIHGHLTRANIESCQP